ncbi:MAG: ParB N-terminal domain-containing protein [Thermoplasmata archaeon]|nr:ParB N-terminal domain-containing protein [Thermoplasmata archaeon]MCI4355705.1 ParB N-terminal domain-containing protein [Thermoplasmata archaeon]
MSDGPTFELIPTERLKIHEEVRPELVAELVERIRRDGFVQEPIWVARGSDVVLNGHHRLAALRALGAQRIPAWVFEYESDAVVLERWDDGPRLAKPDVVERARSGLPYPPKTTKHLVQPMPPSRPTSLELLGVPLVQVRPAGPRAESSRAPDGR